jgi:RNA polymerase sigma-70 factor (ECF subfamily)
VERDQFISIIGEYRNLIYKVCNSYCSNKEDRKDLQQEIMIQLWLSFTRFNGRVKLSTWIYKVALNTAISFYRKDSKMKRITVAVDEIITLAGADPGSESDDMSAMLYGFIGQLNDLDKALILMYLDGNNYKETAEVLGLSETNVATKISRIRKNLRNRYNNNK